MSVSNEKGARGGRVKRKGSLAIPVVAVLAVAVLLLSSMPVTTHGYTPPGNGEYTGDASNEWHVVRYHMNRPASVPSSNGDTAETALDVLYYGSIVSTEYNPQFWEGTISTPTDPATVDNWLPINSYVENETLMFAGWMYHSNSGAAHYPGEVLSKSDLDNKDSDGVINVYAKWDTLKKVARVESNATFSDNTVSNLDDPGSPYTNVLLIGEGVRLNVGSSSLNKPMTVRTLHSSTGTDGVAVIQGTRLTMNDPVIIDDIGLYFTATGTHGSTGNGIVANGHPLIMGAGIMSYYRSADQPFNGYATLRGGGMLGSGNSISSNHGVSVYPESPGNISTALIVHSGTWSNIVGGNYSGTVNGSTYTVIRNATVLDTVEGAGASGGSGDGCRVNGSVYIYLVGASLVADSYEEAQIERLEGEKYKNPLPYRYGLDDSIPAWPRDITSPVSNQEKLFLRESTILTGGGNSGGGCRVGGDTNVYVSGTSSVWDAQAAGRHQVSPVGGTASIELSGKAISRHVLCGSITDGMGSNSNTPIVMNTNVVVKDSAMAATVCGGGYDTWSRSEYSAMFGDESTLTVEIKGGTVCNVYGGGFKSITGKVGSPVKSVKVIVSGGVVKGDVYGGGSGGLDKTMHANVNGDVNSNSQFGSGAPDSTGRSQVYAKEVSVEVTGGVIEGSVFGGGKSVPVLKYSLNGTSSLTPAGAGNGNVAAVYADTVSVDVSGGEIKGDVYGGGRGTRIISGSATGGLSVEHYINMIVVTKDGRMEFMPWFSGSMTVYTADKTYCNDYAEVVCDNINVNITNTRVVDDEAIISGKIAIDGNVFGAGARGPAEGEATVKIEGTGDGGVAIGGSVYGGGLMKTLTGSTSVDISGKTSIGYSVYGGGDVGIREVSASEAAARQVLVTGNSSIKIDGGDANSVGIGRSIIGDGNSCAVAGERTIEVTGFKPAESLESIQNADLVSIVGSEMGLSGRGTGITGLPTDLYSLYDIGDLRMIGGSTLRLGAEVEELHEYGSYDAGGNPTIFTSPYNTIVLNAGTIFAVEYRENGILRFGEVHGYTALSNSLSDRFYGAYAMGSQESDGGFVVSKGTSYEVLRFVDRNGKEGSYEDFRLWVLMGADKRSISLTAQNSTSNMTSRVLKNVEGVVEIVTQQDNSDLLFTGATVSIVDPAVSLVTEEESVSSGGSAVLSESMMLKAGYGNDSRYTRFNYNNGSGTYDGVVVTADSVGRTDKGSSKESISQVNVGLWYDGRLQVTGNVGHVVFQFEEAIPVIVQEVSTYIPVCITQVYVEIYCVANTNTFAGADGNQHVYDIDVAVDADGNGSGKFVIPMGYYGSTLQLENVAYSGPAIADEKLEMRTSVNVYGSQGWIGAIGVGGTLSECMSAPAGTFNMSGSFNAKLVFDAIGVSDEDRSTVPELSFVITDGNLIENSYEHRFKLRIHIIPVAEHKVTFYSQAYTQEMLEVLSSWPKDKAVIPPMFTLAGSCSVANGDTIHPSQYPLGSSDPLSEYMIGWYEDIDLVKRFDTSTPIAHDMSLYAGYRFDVTFDVVGTYYLSYYQEIISGNVDRLTALYEDDQIPARITYHDSKGTTTTYTNVHLGQMVKLLENDDPNFVGWVMDGKLYPHDFLMVQGDMEFTALYESDSDSTIVYHEGSGNDEVTYSLSAKIGDPIRLDHEFVGWVMDDKVYYRDTPFIPYKSDVTFRALYEYDFVTATVQYKDGAEVVRNHATHLGDIIVLDDAPEGCVGWKLDRDDGVIRFYPGGSSFIVFEADDGSTPAFTLQAVHSGGAAALTFQKQIGEGRWETISTEASTIGGTTELHGLDDPAFRGWLIDNKLYEAGTVFTVYKAESVFTAVYEDPDDEVRITYYDHGRQLFEGENGNKVFSHMGAETIMPNPSVFIGYVIENQLRSKHSTAFAFKETEDAYALYEEPYRTATVTYKDGSGNVIQTVEGHLGQTITLAVPSIEGFIAWVNTTGTLYYAGDYFVMYKENAVLSPLIKSGADHTLTFKSGDDVVETLHRKTGDVARIFSLPSSPGFVGWVWNGSVYAERYLTVFKKEMDLYALYSDDSREATLTFAEYVDAGDQRRWDTTVWKTVGNRTAAGDLVYKYGGDWKIIGNDEVLDASAVNGLTVGDTVVAIPAYEDIRPKDYSGTDRSDSFIGWDYKGTVYYPGQRFKVPEEEVVFTALFDDPDSKSCIIYSKKVLTHLGDLVDAHAPDNSNGFVGWTVGDNFYPYVPGSTTRIRVALTSDAVAIPVYKNDREVPVSYVDQNGNSVAVEGGVSSCKHGYSFEVPSPRNGEDFLGWYCDGFRYMPGSGSDTSSFTVTDYEPVVLIALYKNDSITVDVPRVPEGSVAWVWNGVVRTPGTQIVVPDGVEVELAALTEDKSKELYIDFGSSLFPTETHPGQTIRLRIPTNDGRFDGWVSGDEMYAAGGQMIVENNYNYIYKYDVDEEVLKTINPGFTSDGKWYDGSDSMRFTNAAGTDHAVDNTLLHLKWTAKKIKVQFVAFTDESETAPISVSLSGSEIVYSEPFGDIVDRAAAEVIGKLPEGTKYKSLVWEIRKSYDGRYLSTGMMVYRDTVFVLPDYKALVEVDTDGNDILYLYANLSGSAIIIEQHPGQQYVPMGETTEFEPVFADRDTTLSATFERHYKPAYLNDAAIAIGSAPVYVEVDGAGSPVAIGGEYSFVTISTTGEGDSAVRIATAVDGSGFAGFAVKPEDPVTTALSSIQGFLGGTLILPKLDGGSFVGWVAGGVLYKDKYVFATRNDVAFVPLFGSDDDARVVLQVDSSKGSVSVGAVTGKVGGSIDLSGIAVTEKEGFRLIGWTLGGRLVDTFTFIEKHVSDDADPVLVAAFRSADSAGSSSLVFNGSEFAMAVDGGYPECMYPLLKTSAGSTTASVRAGIVYDLPHMAAPQGQVFVGWRVVEEGGETVSYMADSSGSVSIESFPVVPLGTTITIEGKENTWATMPEVIENYDGWVYGGNVYGGGDSFILRKYDGGTLFKIDAVKNGAAASVIIDNSEQQSTAVVGGEYRLPGYSFYYYQYDYDYLYLHDGSVVSGTVVLKDVNNVFKRVYRDSDYNVNYTVGDISNLISSGRARADSTITLPAADRVVAYECNGAYYKPGDEVTLYSTSDSTRGRNYTQPLVFTPLYAGEDDVTLVFPLPGSSYSFHFMDASRPGYRLDGWEFSQVCTEDGQDTVQRAEYNHGDLVSITLKEDEYRLQHGTEEYIVGDPVPFTAIWERAVYTVEIRAPLAGSITYSWKHAVDDRDPAGGVVTETDGTKKISVYYGEELSLEYKLPETEGTDVQYRFISWEVSADSAGTLYTLNDEEEVWETTPTRTGARFDVGGNAHIEVRVEAVTEGILDVYKTKPLSPISLGREIDGEDMGPYIRYRVPIGVPLNLSSENVPIKYWIVNGVPQESGALTFNANTVVVPIPLLDGVSMTFKTVRHAFAENDAGRYELALDDRYTEVNEIRQSHLSPAKYSVEPVSDEDDASAKIVLDAKNARGVVSAVVVIYYTDNTAVCLSVDFLIVGNPADSQRL